MKKENVIVTKSFDFALDILDFYLVLKDMKHFDLAQQVVKSGTSIGQMLEKHNELLVQRISLTN